MFYALTNSNERQKPNPANITCQVSFQSLHLWFQEESTHHSNASINIEVINEASQNDEEANRFKLE